MSKVTIIIPNYNGKHFLYPCMNALLGQTYTDFDVLIVDNGSTDGSQEVIRSFSFPFPVRGIFLTENTGFSGAVNAGIYEAEGEYVILLNNDTEACPGYVGELAAALDRDRKKRVFAVSPKMIQLYHKDLLDDAGDGYNLLGWAFQRGVGQPVSTLKFNCAKSVFSACAGAAIYRKDLLQELALPKESGQTGAEGGAHTGAAAYPEYFDLQHFAYLEDIDLCYRARVRGYDVRYCPEAEVYHVGSGTSGSKYNAFKVRLAARNNVYLNYKNMPLLQLFINLPFILTGVLVKLSFFTKIGFGKEYRAGFAEGIKTLSACRKTRFRIKNLPHYFAIELRLIGDTFSYIGDFLRRHL
ncbi:MAG: glycosyltransferase family 2 protein [Eubacteriales bacterium]|nr:glycosyltransferase family 2 protein [Eubacteriales bacterium]